MNEQPNIILGRPRDCKTSPLLMKTARKLVLEHGYTNVTIQQIIEMAGVSKQTLYRRWKSKAELVLDAFFDSAEKSVHITGTTLDETLPQFLEQLFYGLETDGPAIRMLIAAAQLDPEFCTIFKERFVKPREKKVISLIQRAIKNGEIKQEVDFEIISDVIHGVLWYRLLQGESLDKNRAYKLSIIILSILTVTSSI